MANIEEKVENSISKIIENLGYKLYDVQYAKEGKDYFLRIFTDILDKDDYIKEQYFLEVSSTGVEKMIRKDKHLKENIGEYITIKLFKPINNFKEYVGKLKSFDDQIITIEVENEELNIERKNISLIKKYYDWNV